MTDSHQHTARGRIARIIATLAALAIASISLAGVGGASAPDRVRHQGGAVEISFGLENETDTANGFCLPRSQLAISGIQVVAAVYDTLTVPNSKGEFVPYLAESVEPNADFTEWTITLREGVTFHDGTPLNAEAVKLNLDTFAGKPGLPNTGLLFPSIQRDWYGEATVVDDLTLTVSMLQPLPQYPAFLYGTGRVGIVAPAQLNAGDACATDMIGTGPFVCNEGCWTPGESMVLDANPDYWQKGYPKADQLTFVPVAETAQRFTALRGGDLDVVHLDAGEQILQLDKASDDLNLMIQQPGLREIRYYFMNSSEPPFDDPNARLAVAHAINREEIEEIIHSGVFDIASGIMDVDAPGYLKNAGIPKHDPKKAAELVEQVIAENGSFEITLLADTSDPSNVREAQLIQEQLEEVGITATLPPAANQASFINDAVAGNFGLFLWRNLHGGSTTMVDVDLYPWFGAESLVNFGQISDPELEAALTAVRASSDINETIDAAQEVNRIVSENVYILPMWFVDWTIGSGKDVSLKAPKLPGGGGKPLFVYGRIPVLGITK